MKKKNKDYLLVGLTGGIGSGKSLAAQALRELGRTVISADQVAHALTEKNLETQSRIRETFGNDVFMTDGSLNRKKLASIVFSDPARLLQLNHIIHPLVTKEIVRTIDQLPIARRRPYVAIEAALVFESGLDSILDYTVVVHANDKVRIDRVVRRDGFSVDQVTRRMELQIPTKELLELADFTIENNATETELHRNVRLIDSILTALTREKSS
ncbi:MAG: dephospho-CoA kinase [Bacteroidota bacterium]